MLKVFSLHVASSAAQFANTWICLGGIILPLLYFLVVKTFRICVFPNCKWDIHIAAITKLRRKTHSPCVRRQGVCHTIPAMAITAPSNEKLCSPNNLTIPSFEMPYIPTPRQNTYTEIHTNGNVVDHDSPILLSKQTSDISSAGNPDFKGDQNLRNTFANKRELPQVPNKINCYHSNLL